MQGTTKQIYLNITAYDELEDKRKFVPFYQGKSNNSEGYNSSLGVFSCGPYHFILAQHCQHAVSPPPPHWKMAPTAATNGFLYTYSADQGHKATV